MVNVHGLAASIRSAQESEVFDLAGQNVTSIQQTIRSAFSEPFEIQEMIRITLITGAGKLGRQKYDDGAARAVTSILAQLGFEEDRGASGTLDCAGTFKMQHDTGKNLKTIVVYPKVSTNDTSSTHEEDVPSFIPINSPDYKIAMSSISTFRHMAKIFISWSDKKGCLACIENLLGLLQDLEDKLCKGTILDASEQDFYDNVTELDEKQAYVKKLIQEQIFEQQITEAEKETLLSMVSEKIASLQKENKSTIKMLQRKEALLEIESIPPYKLKHENEIRKIVKDKLSPIEELELTSKGRLLTLKETQIISQKDDVLDLIQQYEVASRGWFEDEDVFQSRLQHSRQDRSNLKNKKAKSSNTKATSMKMTPSSSSSTVNKWILPGSIKAQRSKTTKKTKIKGADVFAAMLMDSSDEESSEEEEEEIKMQPTTKVIAEKTSTKPKKTTKNNKQDTHQKKKASNNINSEVPQIKKSSESSTKLTKEYNISLPATQPKDGKSKKKKSKKKNKIKEKSELAMSAQALATPEKATSNQLSVKNENKSHIVIVIVTILYEIIRDYLIPLFVTILTWIIGNLFGTKKKNRGAKKR